MYCNTVYSFVLRKINKYYFATSLEPDAVQTTIKMFPKTSLVSIIDTVIIPPFQRRIERSIQSTKPFILR